MNKLLQIPCTHCRSLNRVPNTRLTDRPICGHCHAPLFTGQPFVLTTDNFELHASRSDIPLVVDFWAAWCGPCQVMAPAYHKAAKMLEPEVRAGKINSDEERSLAARFEIVSIPTLIIFREGRELGGKPGIMETHEIVRWVRSFADSNYKSD